MFTPIPIFCNSSKILWQSEGYTKKVETVPILPQDGYISIDCMENHVQMHKNGDLTNI